MSGTLREAFDLFNKGEKQQAAKLLAALVIQQPYNASAWYGLALCVDETDKKIYCLGKVLSINPNHTKAKQEIEKLTQRTDMKKCPFCAANNQEGAIICSNCGRDLVDNSSFVKESSDFQVQESEPDEPRIIQQPEFGPVRRKADETKSYGSIKVGAIIIVLIGVIGALFYTFYRMNQVPLAPSESLVFSPNPTNTSQPPTAAPNPGSDPDPPTIIPPYYENFSNGPGIWHVRNDHEVSFMVSDKKYVIKPKNPGGSWWTSSDAKLDNILLEFTTSFLYSYPLEDGGFRVNFRCMDPDNEKCYIMYVSESGYLYVHREENTLVDQKRSQYINLYDNPNQWAIVMDGSDFEIYCNGELLAAFSDNKYKSGDFGFGVFNSEIDEWGFNGVAFDEIRVTALE
jgi:ribosomal protein L24E